MPRPFVPALAALFALLLTLLLDPLGGVAAQAQQVPPPPVTYRPPVEGQVTDPFRPPATPYGQGNRGLEYATARGAVVAAPAGGVVTFAGQVGGRLYVTVQHPDGVRTTSGPLGRITPGVARGVDVAAGDALGTSPGSVLWTARVGDTYVDPAILLAASGTVRVRLVPLRPLGPR